MARSIDKVLADAHAQGARNCAAQNPDNARMQQLAKEATDRAARTK